MFQYFVFLMNQFRFGHHFGSLFSCLFRILILEILFLCQKKRKLLVKYPLTRTRCAHLWVCLKCRKKEPIKLFDKPNQISDSFQLISDELQPNRVWFANKMTLLLGNLKWRNCLRYVHQSHTKISFSNCRSKEKWKIYVTYENDSIRIFQNE